MAVVQPFQAWHYNSSRISISNVVCPPYDIIKEDENKNLHEKDPYNFIRLELGIPDPKNPPPDFVYQTAAKHLKDWAQKQVLVSDQTPSYYLCEMDYPHPFQPVRLKRLAVFGILMLEPFERKIVFPHEKTHSTAKTDRTKLLNATGANFSPIFGLYEDQTKTVDDIYSQLSQSKPLFEFQDQKDIVHRLWAVSDPPHIEALRATFDGRRLLIADGHHRYETALNHARSKNQQGVTDGTHSWDWVMTACVRFHDPGLLILPIHRLILNSVQLKKEVLLEGLKKHFVLHPISKSGLRKISEGSITEGFGMSFSEGENFILELKDRTLARQCMPDGKPALWYELDMTRVSYLILESLLDIDASRMEQSVAYSADLDEIMAKLKEKKIACAFILRPVTAQMIKEICESGELMPQKSTFFYPKFPSGLLIYRH